MSECVVVGVSGGVDSALSADLLIEQGYQVVGVFMKNWDEDDDEHCPAKEDLLSAQQVCDRLDIELRTVSFSHEYWENVFEHFLATYRSGGTPNPDTLCNREIKFKAFLEYAKTLGAKKIATGHYAQIANVTNGDQRWRLLRGADPDKDQTYFLYMLNREALRHSLFPIGNLLKSTVREMAKKRKLPCYDRNDSTGICFIGERRMNEFLSRYIDTEAGNIVDMDGRILGQHKGAALYTIGQRGGLGIGGIHDSDNGAWYVVDKDIAANQVTVVQGHDHPALLSRIVHINDLHWIDSAPDNHPALTAKCRYRQADTSCSIKTSGGDNISNNSINGAIVEVQFEQAQWAVAPGQALVFYDGEHCLGGGTIVGGSS